MDNIQQNGPVFEARPGWGGKIKNWLAESYKQAITIVLVTLILATGLVLAIKQKPLPKLENPAIINETVAIGDSKTLLSRRALADYLAKSPVTLSNGQKVFIEEVLRKVMDQNLTVGEQVQFRIEDIKTAIIQSQQLSPTQLAKWEMYARNVRF